ncbi:MAG: cytochrome P450 [Ilumatobacteraceae bacterium]
MPTTAPPGHPQTVDDVDLFDPATQEDWYPTYDLLREQAPIWRMPGTDTYVLTRYEDVNHVLRRTETFLRGADERTPGRGMSARTAAIYAEQGWPRMAPLAVDPPVHRRYREIADPFFSVQGAEQQRALITGIVDELLDGVAGRGEMEYVVDVAIPLPVRVITTMMGFRTEDIPQLKVWSEAWVLPFRGQLTEEEEVYAGKKGVEFQHHIHDTVRGKREHPDDSVISFFANDARFKGERPLTDAEIIGMADHLYIGGNETTTFALTSGLWLLLADPDVHAAVLADRSRIRNFVEEVLRLESPTMGMVRHTAKDTEIAGVPIPKGSSIHLRYAAANRDPRMFERPAELDLERRNASKHMAFSIGETHCPGAGLSRLEQNIALERILDRLPNLHLARGRNDFTHHPNVTLRAMKQLWVEFDPVPS